jgi:hypothetical protein
VVLFIPTTSRVSRGVESRILSDLPDALNHGASRPHADLKKAPLGTPAESIFFSVLFLQLIMGWVPALGAVLQILRAFGLDQASRS